MSVVGQFILYNLFPALLSGLLAWLVISASFAVLRIEYSPLRLSLLYAPVVKASLVMFGIGLAFPWPREFFVTLNAKALPALRIIPFFLLWSGLILFLRIILMRRAQQLAVQNSVTADQAVPRLVSALDRVMTGYQASDPCRVGSVWANCCLDRPLPRPRLRVSKQTASPYLVNDKVGPTLVFPAGLAAQLTDDELCAALAHEIAHLTLEQPAWCSSIAIQQLAGIAPLAGLLAGQLHREREKACDDMAIAVFGQPEIFASMLLKSYRFACQEAHSFVQRIQSVQSLLGSKPKLSERIERLTHPNSLHHIWLQRCVASILWIGVVLLF